MKVLSLTVIAGILLTACAQTPTAPYEVKATKPSYKSISYPHFKRANLVVTDIERALTIYRDILGLEANAIGESSSASFSYPVFNFPATSKLRSVTLNEPGEARTLALTEVSGMTPLRPPTAPHMTAHVIGVTALKEKIAMIKALGLETTHSKIAGGAEFEFIEQAFVDYDGHLIVLYEVLSN